MHKNVLFSAPNACLFFLVVRRSRVMLSTTAVIKENSLTRPYNYFFRRSGVVCVEPMCVLLFWPLWSSSWHHILWHHDIHSLIYINCVGQVHTQIIRSIRREWRWRCWQSWGLRDGPSHVIQRAKERAQEGNRETCFVCYQFVCVLDTRYVNINRQAPITPPTKETVERQVHTYNEGVNLVRHFVGISSSTATHHTTSRLLHLAADFLRPQTSTPTELWTKTNLQFFAW